MSAPNVRILFLPPPQLHRTLAVHRKVEPIATREISMCVITWPMAWHSNILLLDLASKADAKQAHHKLYKSPTAHPDSIQNRSHELIP
jgi:hypothetical protein